MTATLRHALHELYYQHGLFTFLFLFAPLLPGLVEKHTSLFLLINQAVAGDVNASKEAISFMFGRRGLLIYDQFKELHKPLILPAHIFAAFYQQSNPQKGLKLLSYLFFDTAQRSHPHSHLFRVNVIREYPFLLAAYKGKEHQHLRSLLIQKLYSAALIARSPEVKTAAVDIAQILLHEADTIELHRRQFLMDVQFDMLSYKIKAELAGHATAGDAAFFRPSATVNPYTHLLSKQDRSTLQSIIRFLMDDAAPEVKDKAQMVWKERQTQPVFT